MSSLIVGGVAIKVAVSSPRWTRSDAVDRARAFDNTFRASQTGGAVRTWDFETPAVLAATEGETYKAALSTIASQLCSGDILAIPTMCSAELTDGVPTSVAGDPYVVLSFTLHEQQPAKVLLRYAPGDTITGESFTRSTTAFYMTTAGVLTSAAINAKRDNHFTSVGGARSLLLEDARTNGLLRSQEFDNVAWGTNNATIAANTASAPDGSGTGDALIETATTAVHQVYQPTSTTASTSQAYTVYARANGRTWCYIQTFLRDGTTPATWVNLSTGAIGTTGAGHTVRVTALQLAWYRIEVVVNSGAGAGTTYLVIGAATADAVESYLGDITKGIYVWGAQHEQDKPFATSYIPTTTVAVARGADSYSLPFTTPPQEMTVYAKFVESGSLVWSATVAAIESGTPANPRWLLDATAGFYRSLHHNGTAPASSAPAVAPAMGDTVELLGRVFGDGSVDTTQALNAGASASGAQSSANAFAPAWSDDLLWLNSSGDAGGGLGFIAIQSLKILAGARSLAEMRAL